MSLVNIDFKENKRRIVHIVDMKPLDFAIVRESNSNQLKVGDIIMRAQTSLLDTFEVINFSMFEENGGFIARNRNEVDFWNIKVQLLNPLSINIDLEC